MKIYYFHENKKGHSTLSDANHLQFVNTLFPVCQAIIYSKRFMISKIGLSFKILSIHIWLKYSSSFIIVKQNLLSNHLKIGGKDYLVLCSRELIVYFGCNYLLRFMHDEWINLLIILRRIMW